MKLLAPHHYPLALQALRRVPLNTNFAEVVLRQHIAGKVYGDAAEQPGAFLVAHPCGMSLLYGESDSADFESEWFSYLENRGGARMGMELLQVFPATWEQRIARTLAGRIVNGATLEQAGISPAQARTVAPGNLVEWVRLNFAFDASRYRQRQLRPLPAGLRVARVGAEAFGFAGTTTPRFFWASAEDFGRRATAFAVLRGDEVVSLAFSAFVLDDRLEIGIETRSDSRGQGLALHACAAFIEHCLDHGLEPVWSCRQGNLGSERTARALGFVESRQLPYFALVQ